MFNNFDGELVRWVVAWEYNGEVAFLFWVTISTGALVPLAPLLAGLGAARKTGPPPAVELPVLVPPLNRPWLLPPLFSINECDRALVTIKSNPKLRRTWSLKWGGGGG